MGVLLIQNILHDLCISKTAVPQAPGRDASNIGRAAIIGGDDRVVAPPDSSESADFVAKMPCSMPRLPPPQRPRTQLMHQTEDQSKSETASVSDSSVITVILFQRQH